MAWEGLRKRSNRLREANCPLKACHGNQRASMADFKSLLSPAAARRGRKKIAPRTACYKVANLQRKQRHSLKMLLCPSEGPARERVVI